MLFNNSEYIILTAKQNKLWEVFTIQNSFLLVNMKSQWNPKWKCEYKLQIDAHTNMLN